MKELKLETTNFYYRYEAVDGTIHDTREACEQYEKTTRCVLYDKLKDYIVKKDSEYAICNKFSGSEDNDSLAIYLKDESVADTLYTLFLTINPQYVNNEHYEESRLKIQKTIYDAAKKKDIIFMGMNGDADCMWIMGTKDDMIKYFQSFDELKK